MESNGNWQDAKLVINASYQYEDNDSYAILRTGLVKLTIDNPAYFAKPTYLLACVDNIPIQLEGTGFKV